MRSGAFRHPPPHLGVIREHGDRLCERHRVVRFDQQAGRPDDIRQPAHATRDHWAPRGESLGRGESARLGPARRHHEQVERCAAEPAALSGRRTVRSRCRRSIRMMPRLRACAARARTVTTGRRGRRRSLCAYSTTPMRRAAQQPREHGGVVREHECWLSRADRLGDRLVEPSDGSERESEPAAREVDHTLKPRGALRAVYSMAATLVYRGRMVVRPSTTKCRKGAPSRPAAVASPSTTVGIAEPVRGEKWSPG